MTSSRDLVILAPQSDRAVEHHTLRLLTHWWGAGLIAERWLGDGQLPEGRALLIQFMPALYADAGRRRLPLEAARRARAQGVRVGLFVHEPWTPAGRLPSWLRAPFARRRLGALRRAVDRCFTPVPLWASLLDAQPMPVGATVPVPRPFEPPPPDLPWLVFSPFSEGLRWDWISTTVEPDDLMVAGATGEELAAHPATAPYAHQRWRVLGHLHASEVVPTLARAGAVLCPYADGLTARRTVALAALASGAPVISSRGPLFDAVFERSPVRLADSAELLREELAWVQQEPRGTAAQMRWYDQQFDAERLDRALAERLLG